MKCDRI